MSLRPKRAIIVVLPAAALLLACATAVIFSERVPSRLSLDLAWAAPSAARPFGSGEAGVDLFALVSHATLRALALAGAVATFGFLVGTPLGAAAGLARGRAESWMLRA
jgi:peptide/nickel transport system permease protein